MRPLTDFAPVRRIRISLQALYRLRSLDPSSCGNGPSSQSAYYGFCWRRRRTKKAMVVADTKTTMAAIEMNQPPPPPHDSALVQPEPAGLHDPKKLPTTSTGEERENVPGRAKNKYTG